MGWAKPKFKPNLGVTWSRCAPSQQDLTEGFGTPYCILLTCRGNRASSSSLRTRRRELMEEVIKQILGFNDWDARKKGHAVHLLNEENLEISLDYQTMSCRLHSMKRSAKVCASFRCLTGTTENNLPYLSSVRTWPRYQSSVEIQASPTYIAVGLSKSFSPARSSACRCIWGVSAVVIVCVKQS